jgi:hypothetical protein
LWIIPKTLNIYLSVQATEGLILDLKELSEECGRSLLWRSKPSTSSTWLRRLKQDSLTKPLSSQTLKPSHTTLLMDTLTSSAAAFPANPSAPQDSAEETATPATFGPSSERELEPLDLPLFSWRTSKASCQAASRVTGGATPQKRPFCSTSSASWNAWVIKQRREYSAREKSAPPIDASGFSSWASEVTSRPSNAPTSQDTSSQSQTAQTWPTPKALEVNETPEQWSKRRARPSAKNMGPSLTVAAKIAERQEAQTWLTPATTAGGAQEPLFTATGEPWTGEGRAYRANGVHRTLTLNLQVERTEEQPTPHQEAPSPTLGSLPASQVAQGKLNPRWVEVLMGLPVGWTMPSCATPWTIEQTNLELLETELCQTQRREPLESSSPASCEEPATCPTPPASQRGEDLRAYFRKCINRMKQGGQPFAPTLQVSVEAEALNIDPPQALAEIKDKIHQDTEHLLGLCLQLPKP